MYHRNRLENSLEIETIIYYFHVGKISYIAIG